MNFVILPSEKVMSIDNASVELDTRNWIPSNVEIVAWHGDTGTGFIEYNDRPRVLQKIDTLEDYEGPIDAWIDAASKLSAALNLLQARQIKIDVIEAFYNNKRARPYAYGGWQYDASDEAVRYMAAAVIAFALPDRINEIFGDIVYAINGDVGLNNLSATRVNGWSSVMQNNWAQLHMGHVAHGFHADVGPAPYTHAHTGNVLGNMWDPYVAVRVTGGQGFEYMTGIGARSIGGGGIGAVNWQPLNAGAPVSIDANEFRNALLGMVNRRVALNEVRVRKKGEIQVLGSIPSIVAYPASAGWP